MSKVLLKSSLRAFAAFGLAVVVAWATQTVGRVLSEHVPGWTWAPAWLTSGASWVGEPAPAGFNYQTVVTAALAVTGTLAAVYFATVAFVVSTTYRDATARVRSLVTRIPEGRVYTFVYVQAVLFALAIMLFLLSGNEPNRLPMLTLALLAALVVVSFGRLRTQLYGLLEPAGLLTVIRKDISRWTRYVSSDHSHARGWRVDTSRSRVLESLTTLRELCRLIRQREHVSQDPSAEYASVDPRVLSAVYSVTGIWLSYAEVKHRLIGAPGWCPPRERHKDWLIANNFEVGVALGTATSLRPDASGDQVWLERHLASVFTDLLAGRNVAQYARLTGDLSHVVRHLMARGLFDDARLWLDVVVLPAREMLNSPTMSVAQTGDTPELTRPAKSITAHEYNLVDFIVLSYSQAVLGLQDYAFAMTQDFPYWTGHQARGETVRRVGPGPSALFRNLEDGLAFERTTEGRNITSDANTHQLAARAIATELIDQATWLVDALEDVLMPWVQQLCQTLSLAAASALSRMYETLHKADEVLLPVLERCFAACETVHHDTDDTWPDLDIAPLRARLARLSGELRLPTARLASQADVDVEPDRPDTFGWAFYRAHDDLLDDILRGDPTPDMRERLDLLVAATDRAGSRIQGKVRRTHVRVANSYRAEPLLLLLQLSGIAYVQGTLNGRGQLFSVFTDVWTNLLEADAQRVLEVALVTLVADDQLLGLSPGKMTRSARAKRAMNSFDFLGNSDGFGFNRRHRRRGGRETAPNGLDGRAAAVADHLSIRGDFEDIFVAAWLLPESIARGAVRPEDLSMHPLFESLVDSFQQAHYVDADLHADAGNVEPCDEDGER